MERKQSVEDRVREWLNENGYDYEVRTYQLGEAPENRVSGDKEIISVPSSVEVVDAFMKQFVESFEKAHEITVLKESSRFGRAEGGTLGVIKNLRKTKFRKQKQDIAITLLTNTIYCTKMYL